jgi:hypothetical protein
MPSLAFDIRERLVSYLEGEASLDELRDWLVPVAWDLDPVAEPEAADLAYSAELHFAEYTSGDLSEDELRTYLRELFQTIALGDPGLERTRTASAAVSQSARWSVHRLAAADKQREAVSA